jgi:hypothetical protein
MRAALVAFILFPAVAIAQPADDPPEICTCDPPPMPRKLPADEALALGSRLATALQSNAIAKRVAELVEGAEARSGWPPELPSHPNGPIRAVGQVRPPLDWAWGIKMQARAAEHVGLIYAWRYSVDELKPMVAFFESPAGRKYLDDHGPVAPSEEIAATLRSPELEEDLLEVVCGRPLSAKTLAPHHDFVRLHRPVEGFGPPNPPAWCAEPGNRSETAAR